MRAWGREKPLFPAPSFEARLDPSHRDRGSDVRGRGVPGHLAATYQSPG